MEHHHNNPNYVDPHYGMIPNQAGAMYFQNETNLMTSPNNHPPIPSHNVPSVDFLTLQPDPSVMQFSGSSANFNPLNPIPIPLLPTEPLPNLNPNPVLKQPEKKKTPTKSKNRRSDPGSASNTSSDQVPHKMIPEYVNRLLERKKESFNDKEFAERALSNLARKLASQGSVMNEWIRAITDEDPNSFCVCVPRPKDGRMTITKATSNAGCKKVFPQIFVCQVFRWPQIVFHHDIKSSSHCQNPGVIKPGPNTNIEEENSFICVNPYHFELSQEAETRLKKQSSSRLPSSRMTTMAAMTSTSSSSSSNQQIQFHGKNVMEYDADDDQESDDEILQFNDDGIDYAKLWDENVANSTVIQPEISIQSFNVEDLLNELNIFTLNKEDRSITPAQREFLEKLGVIDELKSMIQSGTYLKQLPKINMDNDDKNKKKLVPEQVHYPDEGLMPPPSNELCVSTKHQGGITSTETDTKSSNNEDEEDTAIQNLLDDIRGSFERQFDDEFNGFTNHHNNSNNEVESSGLGTEEASRSSSPFGDINIGTTFSITDGQALEDLAATADDILPDEMPLEGLSIPQEVFDNFLEASASDVDPFPFHQDNPNHPF